MQNTESRRLTRASTDQSSELTSESKTTQKQSLSGSATPREEAVKTQTTVDKYLKPVKMTENLEETLKGFAEKLGKVASQEYIENKFKKLFTTELLDEKLKTFKKELNEEITKRVWEEVSGLKNQVSEMQAEVETLKNKVSDLETSKETLEEKGIKLAERCDNLEDQLQNAQAYIQWQILKQNDLEQYTRKNSVRIYGIHDNNENETERNNAKGDFRVKQQAWCKAHRQRF